MKSAQKTILAALICLALSACGNPTTNGAGTEQGGMGTIESAISWTKKITHGWSAKANLTIPAQGIIADALLDKNFVGERVHGAELRAIFPQLSEGEDFKIYTSKLGPASATTPEMMQKVYPFVMPVGVVTDAYRGWQIEILGIFGAKKATEKEKLFYLGFQEVCVEYTNGLMTEIATRLNNDVGVLEDPESAKEAIQHIFKELDKATLKSMWVSAVDHAAERQRTLDLAGSGGVDWSADGSSFSGKDDGLTWTKSGIAWYGKGALSGKQWTIGLESSISKSRDKSSGGSESTSAHTGEKASSGAQPK